MASSIIQTFSSLMKAYEPHMLIRASLPKFSYLWKNLRKDKSWYAGQVYYVPFESGEASNASLGALTDEDDITESQVQKGTISTQPEMYNAMVFNHKDLDSDNPKASFMKLYPQKLKQFTQWCSSLLSQQILNGPAITSFKAVADGGVDPVANDGVIYVDYPERLRIGQKIAIHDSVKGLLAKAFVKNIVISSGKVIVTSNKTLATVVDFSNAANKVTEANGAAIYVPGGDPVTANNFTSLSSILLPSGIGDGSANLYGIAKTSYPFLQSVALDGSTIDEDNILDELMDKFAEVSRLGQGNPSVMLMSIKHANSISKLIKENFRGTYSMSAPKKVGFGQKSFMIQGPEGDIEVVSIREMNDDLIYVIDWASLLFAGSKFFEPMDYGTNRNFYIKRATTGVKYITDLKFYGDLICINPSHNGVIYNISY